MSRRSGRRFRATPLAAALVLGAVGTVALPGAVAAHALGGTFQLPVPLTLYLAGAAAAVAASFLVAAVTARRAVAEPRYPVLGVPAGLSRVVSIALQVVGLVWWFGAIAAGYLIGDITLLPAVLFWIGIWVGLPIVAVLLGNPWPSLSPFRTLHAMAERGVNALGFDRLDVGVRYPRWLARWPAVVLLAVTVWAELILPGSTAAATVAGLMAGYTVLTFVGMAIFGRVGWLRHAELFEVYLGWFGRVGPLGRRAIDPEVCAGCDDACRPERCVDCPECAAVAEPGERRAELRPWFAGLTELQRAGWSDAAFIVFALAAVSYDGLQETIAWGGVLDVLMPIALDMFGPTQTAFTAVGVVGLALVFAIFAIAFLVAAAVTRRLGDPELRPPLQSVAGAYGATLLPIAGGYLVAHYLTLVIQGAMWLPELVVSPLAAAAPDIDWIPLSFVWYLSVAAIVIGHVAAVFLAHRIALRDAPSRPTVAGVPLVVLMVGYTIFSLWIIAQPITVEPGLPAASLFGSTGP